MSSQDVICNLCFETFKNPMLLNCGHNLCEACVKRAESVFAAYLALEPPSKKKGQPSPTAPSLACPLCAKVTPVSDCKPNTTLRNILSLSHNAAVLELPGEGGSGPSTAAAALEPGTGEASAAGSAPVCGFCKGPAHVFCAFCGPLCQEHSDFLHVKGPLRAHELSNEPVDVVPSIRDAVSGKTKGAGVEGTLVLPLCKDHGKQMELFCNKCETLVCAHCVLIGDHKGHECTSVLQAFKKTNERIDELLKTIKEKAPECESLVKGYERLHAGAEKEQEASRAVVKEAFAKFRAIVDEHETNVLKELDDIFALFNKTVEQRTTGLLSLSKECQLVQKSTETTAAKNDLMRYTLFKSLKNLAEHLGVISSAQVPEDATICSVDVNKTLADKSKLSVVKVRSTFRLGGGRVIYYDIDFEAVARSRNVASEIQTGNSTSHDGGAIYDPLRQIILSVSGNFNNGRNLKITRMTDGTHGETTTMVDVVPFGTHGQYPVYDGRQYTYFLESESAENNRIGRVDMDTMTFEAMPTLTGSSFREFCSGCVHNGNLYVLDRDLMLREFNPETREWSAIAVTMPRPGRLIHDPCNAANILCLCCDGRGLYSIDLEARATATVSEPPSNFSLGANGEAFLARVSPEEYLLFAGLSGGWHVYSSLQNRWAALPNWRNVRNGSGHLIIVPEGPTAFYHIDDSNRWEMVNLRAE